MEFARFEDFLDRHGGDLEQWPEAERAAASALLATAPSAQALLVGMQEVETLLRAPVPGAAATINQITARATRHAQETYARRVVKHAAAGAAAAAILVLGILLGDLASMPRDLGPERTLAAAFDAGSAADVD